MNNIQRIIFGLFSYKTSLAGTRRPYRIRLGDFFQFFFGNKTQLTVTFPTTYTLFFNLMYFVLLIIVHLLAKNVSFHSGHNVYSSFLLDNKIVFHLFFSIYIIAIRYFF